MRSSGLFTLLAIALPLVAANSHQHNARHHSEVAKRAGADVGLQKRFSHAKFTFYDAGMGACGKSNTGEDFIVALNSHQYGSGSDCFKKITITANGKTRGATITDECPGCPENGLDMSRALFDFFASESAGVIFGSWDFDDGGTDSSSSSKTTHTSSSTRIHTSHTSSTKKSSSSSTHPHTSTSTSTSASSTSSTTPINYSTGDASGLAVPTGAVVPGAANNLNDLNQAIIGLGALIVAGGNAN